MTDEWFDLHSGGLHLVHRPSGDAVTGHPFPPMAVEQGWPDRIRELAARHPRAKEIRNPSGSVVGSIDDHVAMTAGFEPGDVLVLLDEEGSEPIHAARIHALDPVHAVGWPSYVLDDGRLLRWSYGDGCWKTMPMSSIDEPWSVARRPLAGEEWRHLLTSDRAILRSGIGTARDFLVDLRRRPDRAGLLGGPDAGDLESRMEALVMPLFEVVDDEKALDDELETGSLLGEIDGILSAIAARPDADRAGLERIGSHRATSAVRRVVEVLRDRAARRDETTTPGP